MKPLLYFLLLFSFTLLVLSATQRGSQVAEICDNAIDDDADGLIDINDPDCECPAAEPVSLIPNPSFEDQDCCPSNRSQMDCASGWIQASAATTDYLHTCDWMGWDNLPAPLPFPDGEGCMGFRNGRTGGPGGQGPQPGWKEYAGACLSGPLKAGTTYRFEFYIGFTKSPNSPPTNIVFFGSIDCVNLPFGSGNENFGCPTNGPGWVELGSVSISGTNEWKLKEITVTPSKDIHAIAIGPNCQAPPPGINTYYFFDNLVLAEQRDFDFRITASDHPCSGAVDLSIPFRDTLEYQWYYNGVALVGETGNVLAKIAEEGNYQVRVLGPNSCRITNVFPFRIPGFTTVLNTRICHGETFFFNQEDLATGGTFWDTLKSVDNCDSIIRLDLDVTGLVADTVYAKTFKGESWKIGSVSYNRPGSHLTTLSSYLGCDSLVLLILDHYKLFIPNAFTPDGDGINDHFMVFSEQDVNNIAELIVYDRWGGLVFSGYNLVPGDASGGWDGLVDGKPAIPGVYVYKAKVQVENGSEKELMGSFSLLR